MNSIILSASLLLAAATCSPAIAAAKMDKSAARTTTAAPVSAPSSVSVPKTIGYVIETPTQNTDISQPAHAPKSFQITNTTDSSISVQLSAGQNSVEVTILAHETQRFEGATNIYMSSPIAGSLMRGAEVTRSYSTDIPTHHFYLVARANDGTIAAVVR